MDNPVTRDNIVKSERELRIIKEKIIYKQMPPYTKLKYNMRTKLRNSNASSVLMSFLSLILISNLFLVIFTVLELSYSNSGDRQALYNPIAEYDKFMSKTMWFVAYIIFFVFSLLWYIVHRYYVKQYDADTKNVTLNNLSESQHTDRMVQMNQFYMMNLAEPLQPKNIISADIIQYNRYIYSNFVFYNLLISSFMIFTASITCFNDKINQERFRDYLSIYIYMIVVSTTYTFFIFSKRNM
jgi:preprotein translocase subunit SecG